MQARVFVPPPEHPLRRAVQSIFHGRDDRSSYRCERILPTGNVDLLFNLGDALRVTTSTGTVVLPSGGVHVAGVQTAAFTSHPAARTDLIGISLRMEHAASVLRIPSRELTDRRVDAAAVLPGIEGMAARLHDADDFSARCQHLVGWLQSRIRETDQNRAVAHACRLLRAGVKGGRVARAARELGWSERHFQRVFTATVGVTPSYYVRLMRFTLAQRSLRMTSVLTDVAHSAGYSDQAHFCRDFRAFAGMTPDTYRRLAGPVPGHIFVQDPPMADSFKPVL